MKLGIAALLLLALTVYSINVEASKCRCTRKGPKITFKNVQKVEIKPKHPFCKEKMIFVTVNKSYRYKGKEYCLHPKLRSTRNLIKWFTVYSTYRTYVE
ncbi:C-X-C motif chemokine 14 [Latimeria chalumnae]|uniref:C-X-C motif chemokine ligand 14 n=1 Tax=Latimeria chalumnae TaxID=7897 RepID=M3XK18_LATCH|nr:PREDICTED: C-X-C motif chemokine 14 [Latimeria chalumnae]|eukprot:XP_006003532.1 PREDICTED: C-X-C motif chemokine 14 [Latimeria chalumnae]